MMNTIIMSLQIIFGLILVGLIFIQMPEPNNRQNLASPTSFQKRGWEKFVYLITLTTLFVFILISIIQVIT